jgi:hypothetical protein
VTLLAAAALLLVAAVVAARRRAAGRTVRQAVLEGLAFAAAVAVVYWLVFVYPLPEPWWEEDRARR